MKRKMTAIFMSLMLVLGILGACSSKSSSSGDKILIGANLELTGGVASFGSGILEGLELAVEEINKEGINGKKLEIVKVDNKSEATEATNGALKLMTQDKVVAIVGSATSTNTLAQVELAQKNKVPIVTPSGTNETITFNNDKLNDYLFRTCFIDPFQGKIAGNFAAKDLGMKKAAIITDTASDYAKGLAASFKETFEANGGTIVKEESYIEKDTDFRAILTNIKGANPDFVYVPGYYGEVGLILNQARDIGLDVAFMGGDGWDSPKLLEIAGADPLTNTYFTNHYSSGDTDTKIQEFVKAFTAKYNKTPDAFNALGYDTGYLLADAIKRAGDNPDGEKVKEALEATSGLNLVTGVDFSFDEKHNPIKSATILTFEGGEQVYKAKVAP